MMKTSYHIEKPLFIPVKDDQITGIPSIESGNSQTILEDIDILGDNISSENNAMLGISIDCPGDKYNCSLFTCNPDFSTQNPVSSCTQGLGSSPCISHYITPGYTVTAYTYIVLSLSGQPRSTFPDFKQYAYPITGKLLGYIGGATDLSYVDESGLTHAVILYPYENDLFYGHLGTIKTIATNNIFEDWYSDYTFTLRINGHANKSFTNVLVNSVFTTGSEFPHTLITEHISDNYDTIHKTEVILTTKELSIDAGPTSLTKYSDGRINPMLYTGTKWKLYDRKSYSEGHYTEENEPYFIHYAATTGSASTDATIYPFRITISSPFPDIYFKRERPGIVFPENITTNESAQLLRLDLDIESFKALDTKYANDENYSRINPNGQILTGKDVEEMYPAFGSHIYAVSGVCLNGNHYKAASLSGEFITSGAVNGTKLLTADTIISQTSNNTLLTDADKMTKYICMISSAMTWLF